MFVFRVTSESLFLRIEIFPIFRSYHSFAIKHKEVFGVHTERNIQRSAGNSTCSCPIENNFYFSIFFFETSSAFSKAAPVMMAVPC